MSIDRAEKQDKEPVVETVRGAIFHRGKFLVLEKEATSKNPAALEFPGGKIDEIADKASNPEEQYKALVDEIKEETGIDIQDIPAEKIDDFLIYFETGDKDNRQRHRRRVHLFLVKIPDTKHMALNINETKNKQGGSEDKHAGYKWVSPEELLLLVLHLEENPATHERTRPLSRNSRHIKKLLEAVQG